jgi:hypothetical protein
MDRRIKGAIGPALLVAGLMAGAAQGQTRSVDDSGFTEPCSVAPFTDFDFWIGEWVAFDMETGVVQGIDRIERRQRGCVIHQEWTQLTDRFRTPGAPYRYAGMSISALIPGPSWQQVWVGNAGGAITLQGGLRESDGAMVLVQEFTGPDNVRYHRAWHWKPEADGTIRSWGEVRTGGEDGEWSEPRIPWNLRYVRRSLVGNLTADTVE